MADEPDTEMAADEEPATKETPSYFQALVPALLALIQPTALSFPPASGPSPHPPTTSALGAIHVGALECLNNIFLSLATPDRPSTLKLDEASGQKIWGELWRALGAVGTAVTGAGQERRREMWEVGVGVLWGVGTVWRGALEPDPWCSSKVWKKQ